MIDTTERTALRATGLATGLACGVLAVGVMAAVVTVGFPHSRTSWFASDALFDWVTARALVDGAEPYADLGVLLERYRPGLAESPAVPHPRTPGALVLQMLLLVVPASRVLDLQVVLIVVSSAVLFLLSAHLAGRLWLAALLPLLFFAEPFREAFNTGAQSTVVAALLAWAWWRGREGDRGGLAVGLAATLKLYPLLLIPMLWLAGRRRAAGWAAGVFVGLNALGVWAGASPVRAAGVLADASSRWQAPRPINVSPLAVLPVRPMFVVAAVVGVVCWWVWRGRPSVDRMFLVAVPLMLVLSPLAWRHYQVLLVPVLVVLARPLVVLVVAVWFGFRWMPVPVAVGLMRSVPLVALVAQVNPPTEAGGSQRRQIVSRRGV